MYSYPIWLFLFVLLPLILLLAFNLKKLAKYEKVFYLIIAGALIFSYPWDLIAVKTKVWYFEEPYIFGIYLFGLPIEEYVFIIGFALLFTTVTLLLYERYGKK